ncbi:MAG: glutathione S-transferase family protein [Caulobacteraceae bacterium]
MILYSDPGSPYSGIVRAAIYAKGLDIPIQPPPSGLKSDEYRALSGTGTVPCLILDDGSPLPESTVILSYLDEKFPERPLTPTGLEARARVALLVRLGVEGVIDPIVGFLHDLVLGVAGAHEAARTRLEAGLGKLERFGPVEGFAAGSGFTQADCVLGPALMGVGAFEDMLAAPGLLARHENLAAYAPRAAAHPAVAKVVAELQAALAASGV